MMAAAATLYLALFGLAAGMPRHAALVEGRAPLARFAPAAGWLLLALSLLLAMAGEGRWPFALMEWIGLVPVFGGLILFSLAYGARAAQLAALVAIVCAVDGLA